MNTRDRINSVKNIIRAPYSWPGGYSKVLVMSDGASMCADCVKENYRLILRATRDQDLRSGGAGLYAAIHWEGEPLQCCNCNKDIPSEYGPLDQEQPNQQPVY